MIIPNTEIRLLHVPFEIDNQNELTFTSKQAQEEYFLSLEGLTEDDASYQRKDNIIRFPAILDDILMYNYCMYKNENYSDKWFYAFITDMQYINDNLTYITIETDVFQTWQFDIIYKKMFVEREHVSKADDIIGKYTFPENLETGEYIVDNLTYFNQLDDMRYIIQVTEYTNESSSVPLATNYGGVYVAGRCIYL